MPKPAISDAKILLVNLEGELRRQLEVSLRASNLQFAAVAADETAFIELLAAEGPQVVFTPADSPSLASVAGCRPNLSVIAVSAEPQLGAWLDAIEAGAADYCSAPFEPAEILRILESNLLYRKQAAA